MADSPCLQDFTLCWRVTQGWVAALFKESREPAILGKNRYAPCAATETVLPISFDLARISARIPVYRHLVRLGRPTTNHWRMEPLCHPANVVSFAFALCGSVSSDRLSSLMSQPNDSSSHGETPVFCAKNFEVWIVLTRSVDDPSDTPCQHLSTSN